MLRVFALVCATCMLAGLVYDRLKMPTLDFSRFEGVQAHSLAISFADISGIQRGYTLLTQRRSPLRSGNVAPDTGMSADNIAAISLIQRALDADTSLSFLSDGVEVKRIHHKVNRANGFWPAVLVAL